MKRNYTNILLAGTLIFIAAAARVIFAEAHLYNFVPVGALGLFSGAVIKDKRYAFLLPLLAQFGADVYFQFFTSTPGFYDISQFFTYAALAAVTLLGFKMNKINAVNVLGFTLSASAIFFIISNFGVWLQGWNGTGWAALVKTYVLAVPFYKNTLIGELTGSTVLFGLYYLVTSVTVAKAAKVKA